MVLALAEVPQAGSAGPVLPHPGTLAWQALVCIHVVLESLKASIDHYKMGLSPKQALESLFTATLWRNRVESETVIEHETSQMKGRDFS